MRQNLNSRIGKGHELNGRARKSQSGEPKAHSDPLIAAYDELNSLWNSAEEELQSLRVPVDVHVSLGSYPYGDPDDPEGEETELLAFVKFDGRWRVCSGVYRSPFNELAHYEFKPIAECPVERRVECARHYKALRQKALEAREKYFPRVSAAISDLREAIGR